MTSGSSHTLPLPFIKPSGQASLQCGGFFKYHGFWAPAVRPFRCLGFGSKAWLIAAKKSLGLTCAQQVLPLLDQAIEETLALAGCTNSKLDDLIAERVAQFKLQAA